MEDFFEAIMWKRWWLSLQETWTSYFDKVCEAAGIC